MNSNKQDSIHFNQGIQKVSVNGKMFYFEEVEINDYPQKARFALNNRVEMDRIQDWTGASIGIRLIYPNLKTVKEQKQAIYWLRDAAEKQLGKISDERGEKMPYLNWDKANNRYFVNDECNISLHQVEMWLCEFQKYWKMMIGKGKQRSKFIPKTKEIIVK